MTVYFADPFRLDARRLAARLCLCVALGCIALGTSAAAQAQTTGSIPSGRCARFGEGFVPVAGSDSCVRIGGHVRAGGPGAQDWTSDGMRRAGHSYVRAPTGPGLYSR